MWRGAEREEDECGEEQKERKMNVERYRKREGGERKRVGLSVKRSSSVTVNCYIRL